MCVSVCFVSCGLQIKLNFRTPNENAKSWWKEECFWAKDLYLSTIYVLHIHLHILHNIDSEKESKLHRTTRDAVSSALRHQCIGAILLVFSNCSTKISSILVLCPTFLCILTAWRRQREYFAERKIFGHVWASVAGMALLYLVMRFTRFGRLHLYSTVLSSSSSSSLSFYFVYTPNKLFILWPFHTTFFW